MVAARADEECPVFAPVLLKRRSLNPDQHAVSPFTCGISVAS